VIHFVIFKILTGIFNLRNTSKSDVFQNFRWAFNLLDTKIQCWWNFDSLINILSGFAWPMVIVFVFDYSVFALLFLSFKDISRFQFFHWPLHLDTSFIWEKILDHQKRYKILFDHSLCSFNQNHKFKVLLILILLAFV
jgi:hypothetical protein